MGETHRKVILVEDNLAEAKLTRIAFSAHPNRPEIVHCTDGEKFIELLKEFPLGQISYVLLDLNMPRMNGLDVLNALYEHKKWRVLPIIVFTSSAFQQDIYKCYDRGASAYVVKPVEFDELDRKLTAINNFWETTNCLPPFSDLAENY